MTWHKLAAITAALLIAQTSWAQTAQGGVASQAVPTLTLAAAQAGGAVQFDGVIEALRQSTVAAQVPGNIVERLVKAGDSVKAGQPLMRIDSRDTQAALDMRQAEVAQAQAQLENARLQWERSQSLKAQGFISAAALDAAQAQWKAAQAGVAAAQAGRNQAAWPRATRKFLPRLTVSCWPHWLTWATWLALVAPVLSFVRATGHAGRGTGACLSV